MYVDGAIFLAPLEEFAGTVAEYLDILDGLHDQRSDESFPDRWPFPHDTRRGRFYPSSDDRLWLGRVQFIEGGTAFRHVMIELDGERFQCLAVFGRRHSRAHQRPWGSWSYVVPFVPVGWREVGKAVRRMYAHGIGVPGYCTDGAKGFDVVMLTDAGDGTYDWTSVDESPRDSSDWDGGDAAPGERVDPRRFG